MSLGFPAPDLSDGSRSVYLGGRKTLTQRREKESAFSDCIHRFELKKGETSS